MPGVVRGYRVRQRGRVSPLFFVQVSLVPVDDVPVEPTVEQNWPARAAPREGAWEDQRARVSPGRLRQRAQAPPEVRPTVPVALQKPPIRTVPATVAVAAGALVGAGVVWCRARAEALWATVAAFLVPPHPVSVTATPSATPVSTSGRFMSSPDSQLVPRLQIPVRD